MKVSFEVSIVSLDSVSEALERVSLSFYAARSAGSFNFESSRVNGVLAVMDYLHVARR